MKGKKKPHSTDRGLWRGSIACRFLFFVFLQAPRDAWRERSGRKVLIVRVTESRLNERRYLCRWSKAINRGLTSPTHPHAHTCTHTLARAHSEAHTCTYQGRSSTLHCLRICEWKNGLTHLADRQDFLRFFLRGLEELIVRLVHLSVYRCVYLILSVCLLVYQTCICTVSLICLTICLHVWLFVSPSVFLLVCLSFLFIYLSVWTSTRLSASRCFCLTLRLPNLSDSSSYVCVYLSLHTFFHLQYLLNCQSRSGRNRQTAAAFFPQCLSQDPDWLQLLRYIKEKKNLFYQSQTPSK